MGLEGSGAWLDRRGESEAFSAALGARVDLTRPRAIIPHVFTTRHIEMGPVLDFLIVRHASRSYVVTTFTMRVACHFEEHLIPPD